MTREAAILELGRQAAGLPSDRAGVALLLERLAGLDDAEMLRAYLVEQGALAVIEEASADRTERVRRAVERHIARTGAR